MSDATAVLAIHRKAPFMRLPPNDRPPVDQGVNTGADVSTSEGMARTTPSSYRDERAELRERVRNAESEAERRKAVLRLAEIDREIHADIYEKLARE